MKTRKRNNLQRIYDCILDNVVCELDVKDKIWIIDALIKSLNEIQEELYHIDEEELTNDMIKEIINCYRHI